MSSFILAQRNKSSKALKKILISAPISASVSDSISLTLRSPTICPVVIFKVKYDFVAQGNQEISVHKNELLMPTKKRDDGRIHVQCLDRNAKGLVPCLYVEIVVNDPKKPITMDWFNGAGDSNTIQLTKEQLVERVIISQVLLNESHRLCYKVEAVLESNRIIKCCKGYEDFEEFLVTVNERYTLPKQFQIPAQLVSYVSPTTCSETTKKDIMTVAVGLNVLIQELKRFLASRNSLLLFEFLSSSESNLKVGTARQSAPLASIVLDLLDRPPTGLLPTEQSRSFSPTAPLPIQVDENRSSTSSLSVGLSYRSSNYKYLTYLRSSRMDKPKPKENERQLSRPDSIASLLSLIESYDVSSWDVYDESRSEVLSATPEREFLHMDLCQTHQITNRFLCTGAAGTQTQSSSTSLSRSVSETMLSSRTSETSQVFEPITPPLEHHSLSSLVLPAPGTFMDHDFDLSPLQPQMHQEFVEKKPEYFHSSEPVVPLHR